MPTTSVYYMLFVALCGILYYMIPDKYRPTLLIILSYIFYAINQLSFVLYLFGSTLVNFILCNYLTRKRWLIYVVIPLNIMLLAFFKYLPPIVLSIFTTQPGSMWSRIILPVGISFFTFQAMGYALDIYWKGDRKRVQFSDFILYMSFFPQIMAGPIARSESFVPQIKAPKTLNYLDISNGLRRILWGLFKKIVIAENLKQYVDAVYNNPSMHHGLTIIIATLFYTFQLYCDFSGYSDIAIGSARIFGFRLLENFRVPLLSKSISDFWRRWHISLSSWVRDYVNNPIQYRYRHLKSLGVIIAVFITFMIIGAWHGPRWNYLIFGLIMVFAISFEMFTKNWRDKFWSYFPTWLSSVISTLIVFLLFSFCGIFLRADSLGDVVLLIKNASFSMEGLYTGSMSVILNAFVGLLVLAITDFRLIKTQFDEFIIERSILFRWAYYVGLTIAILSIGVLDGGDFIYFQF